jgi:hypothetical protein
MYFHCYDYVFKLYVYVWLTWLRFFRAFSSVVRQSQGKTHKDGEQPALFLMFVLFYVLFVLFYVLFVLFYVLFVLFYVLFVLFYVLFVLFYVLFVLFYVLFVLFYVLFVLFSVLFVCICVLYYCHRVATQLQLNLSYEFIPCGYRDTFPRL